MPNEQLGAHLNKNHEIQVRLNRSTKRMKVYGQIQDKKRRDPAQGPDTSNETRWQGMIVNLFLLYIESSLYD